MKKLYICENENLMKNLEILKENGYRFIVKGQDKFLSGWGCAGTRKHIQLIACKTYDEMETIKRDLERDDTFNYVNWNYISNKNAIYNMTKGKSFTIRNDWTRCF
jgi:hypothetical protein